MNKKRHINFFFFSVLALIVTFTLVFTTSSCDITSNDSNPPENIIAIEIDDNTYLPLNETFRLLGYKVKENIDSIKLFDGVSDGVEYKYIVSLDKNDVGTVSVGVLGDEIGTISYDNIFCKVDELVEVEPFVVKNSTVYMPAEFYTNLFIGTDQETLKLFTDLLS